MAEGLRQLPKGESEMIPARWKSIAWLPILLSLVLLAGAGCDVDFPPSEAEPGEGPGHRAQQLGLRPEQELALGEQAYHEVLRESRGRILPADDPQVRRVRSRPHGKNAVRAGLSAVTARLETGWLRMVQGCCRQRG
jgi:hypothetical protein